MILFSRDPNGVREKRAEDLSWGIICRRRKRFFRRNWSEKMIDNRDIYRALRSYIGKISASTFVNNKINSFFTTTVNFVVTKDLRLELLSRSLPVCSEVGEMWLSVLLPRAGALRLIELKFANSFMYSHVVHIYRLERVIERVIIRRSDRAKLHFCNLLNVSPNVLPTRRRARSASINISSQRSTSTLQ